MDNSKPTQGRSDSGLNADSLLKNKAAIQALAGSQDAKTLLRLLSGLGKDGLRSAAEAAMNGDSAPLAQLMDQVARDPGGARALDGLERKIREKE